MRTQFFEIKHARADIYGIHTRSALVNKPVGELFGLGGGSSATPSTDGYGPTGTDTYDGCINNKLAGLMNTKVGCTVPWLRNKSNICEEKDKRVASFGIYQDNRRNQQSICKNPCTFSNMYFGPPVGPEPDFNTIIWFKDSSRLPANRTLRLLIGEGWYSTSGGE